MEAERVSECNSRDLFNALCKSKKQKVLRTVNDMVDTALGFNSYLLLERSLFYDDHVAKHFSK